LLAYGAFAGAQALRVGPRPSPRPAVRQTTPAPASLPQAVRLVDQYQLHPEITTAAGGRFFGFVPAGSQSAATVLRIDPDGTVTSRTLTDALDRYFSHMTARGHALFIGTSVIQRFLPTSDELLRLDASTLAVTARTSLHGPIVALATDPQDLWVALEDRILRLDPVSLAVRASYVIPGATPPPAGSVTVGSLARGAGGVWATFGDALHTTLYRFDPSSLAVLSRTDVPESGQGINVVAGPESVWLTGQDFARRVDPSGQQVGSVHVAGLQAAAAQGHGLVAVFYSGNAPETLVQVDGHGAEVARSAIGDAGAQLVVDGRDVWLFHGLSLAHWILVNPTP